MSYAWDITITGNKPAAEPKEQTLDLHPGVITKVEVKFPAGCHGMVKARLFFGRFQIVPLSRGEWVTGDDESVSYPTYHEIVNEPAQLLFQGCSPGTSYSHTITVRVQILPKAVATFMPLVDVLTRFLQKIGVI